MARPTDWEVVDHDNTRHHQEGARRHNSARNLRWLAETLDSRYRIFGIRIGWDAILGLIPGFGDVATNVAGFYIMLQASNLGAPASVILRMGLNLVIDNLFDSVPVFGNIADIFWRANLRNVTLLERYMENPRRATVSSRWVVGLTALFVVLSALLCAALGIYFGVILLRWLFSAGQGW